MEGAAKGAVLQAAGRRVSFGRSEPFRPGLSTIRKRPSSGDMAVSLTSRILGGARPLPDPLTPHGFILHVRFVRKTILRD